MTELLVKRWVRYGHDRLYVQTAEGVRLGYWDSKTGVAHVYDESHRPAFEQALTADGVGCQAAAASAATTPTTELSTPEQTIAPTLETPAAAEATAVQRAARRSTSWAG